MRQRTAIYSLLLMVALFAYLAGVSTSSTPILLDEFAHVPAGVSHWEVGRFNLYRETPPFVQSLVSLPVWLSGPKTDYSRAGRGHRSEWEVGRDFMNLNKEHCLVLFRRARIAVSMLAVSCGFLIFWWSQKTAGSVPAVVAAGLWFSDPSVLANATAATTDVGAAAVCTYACFSFYRFLGKPSRARILLCGVSLGLAEASKFSLLVLYPAWFLLAVMYRRFHPRRGPQGTEAAATFFGKLTLVFLISVLTLNATYGFQGSLRPLGSYGFRSLALSGRMIRRASDPVSGNRFSSSALASLPVPLPEDYVLGVDSQKWEEEIGLKNLAGGRLVTGGSWYSPLATLLYKLPVGTIAYLLLAVGTIIVRAVLVRAVLAKDRALRFEDVMTWTLAISVLILLCTQTGLNWPVRYALPALPFLFISVAQCFSHERERRLLTYALLSPLLLNYNDILAYHSCARSYGNVFAGGPEGAQRIFIGSNFDWGQDLFGLSQWWKDRPEPLPLAVSYYGVQRPESVGLAPHAIPVDLLYKKEETGVADDVETGDFFWAISSNYMHGLTCPVDLAGGQAIYGSIHSHLLVPEKAFARVGYSIYVFRICSSGCRSHDERHIAFKSLAGCITEYREPEDGEIDATP